MSETQTPAAPAADAGSLLDGGAAPGGGAEDRGWLPEEFRADPMFKDMRDPGALAKSYANAARMVGADKADLLRLPKDEAAPEWSEVWGRLGRPEKPEEYGLAAPEGMAPEILAETAGAFHGLNLTKKQAEGVMGIYSSRLEAGRAAEAEQVSQQTEAAGAALRKEWGAEYDNTIHGITRLVKESGGEDALKALNEAGLGRNPAVLKMLAKIASQTAEPNSLRGSGGGAGGAVTAEAAQAEVLRLREDRGFMERFWKGDAEARATWTRLHDAMGDGRPRAQA